MVVIRCRFVATAESTRKNATNEFPNDRFGIHKVLRQDDHRNRDNEQSDAHHCLAVDELRNREVGDRNGENQRGGQPDHLEDPELHHRFVPHDRIKTRRPSGVCHNRFLSVRSVSSMFTGIVETTGEIVAVDEHADGRRLRIRAGGLDDLHHGQSISVSGVCLTVEAFDIIDESTAVGWFEVFLAVETVEKTYLGAVGVGDRVNIERAMAADGRFDGHIVQGHVDTVTTVQEIEELGDDWRFSFALPPDHDRYIVDKGSICLDGISLTLASLDREAGRFSVAIIPTTYAETTLGDKRVGDPVHVEVDVIAKYVEQMVDE